MHEYEVPNIPINKNDMSNMSKNHFAKAQQVILDLQEREDAKVVKRNRFHMTENPVTVHATAVQVPDPLYVNKLMINHHRKQAKLAQEAQLAQEAKNSGAFQDIQYSKNNYHMR
jgi:hypothetical protein